MIAPADRTLDTPDDVESDEVPLDDIPELDHGEIRSDNIEFERVAQRLPKRRKGFRFILLIIIIIVAAGGTWMIWGKYWLKPDPNQIPLVSAPNSAFKIKPIIPGGMPIPNRDITIYDDAFSKDPTRSEGENVQEVPEQPLPVPGNSLSTLKSPDTNVIPPSSKTVETLLPKTVIPNLGVKGKAGILQSSVEPKTSSSATQTPIKNGSKEITPDKESRAGLPDAATPLPSKPVRNLEAVPSSVRISTRSFQIQLAAVRKETAAQNEWRRLKARHRTLLNNLELNVVMADLGAKGIYFRLRAGPLKDAESAKKLCRELSKVKVRCLVIRPEK